MIALQDNVTSICLKPDHYQQILDLKPAIGWLEVHPENYMGDGGIPHFYLERIAQHYPLSFHSIGLSLGSANWQQQEHLKRLQMLVQRYQPALVSDHLSWSYNDSFFYNDLLPLPYTKESLDIVCRNIDVVHNSLQRGILIENPSSYFDNAASDMSETEFLSQIAHTTGARILLDANNIYVNAKNNGFSAEHYIDSIAPHLIAEVHLAGHAEEKVEQETLLIDDHSCRVCDDVWQLYRQIVERCGKVPTLIEWDTDIPELTVLLDEAQQANNILESHDDQRISL